MVKHDIIVVGAGSAGLACAEVLAKAKRDVLILEEGKEIDYKVCAGGLTLKGLKILGMEECEKILQRKFSSLKIHTPWQNIEIKYKKPFLATVDMEEMYQFMAEKVENAGVKTRISSRVTQIKENSLIVNNQEEIGFNYLVGADGPNSIVRKSLGLDSKKVLLAFQYIIPKKFEDLELFLDIDKFGVTYVWIFPYRETTSIGTGGDLTEEGQKILKIKQLKENFEQWCRKKLNFEPQKYKLESSIINYEYQGFNFGHKFLAGDAGGFASGLSGGGMLFAMLSGQDIANKILDSSYKCKNIEHILRVKKSQEKILKLFEINKRLSKILSELLVLLLRNKRVSTKIIENID